MIFTETELEGVHLIDLEPREDERGFFARAWARDELAPLGLATEISQSNIAFSRRRGTLRGLHYQAAPHEEVKFVRCTRGAIFDVVVDLRPGSATYARWMGVELSAENRRAVYVPAGCAHGYLTLVDDSETLYHASVPYAPHAERGVRWNDPAFAIEWPDVGTPLISVKDASWPDFSTA